METALAITGIAISGPPFVEALIKLGEYLVDKVRQHRQVGDQVELCSQIISLNQTQSRLLLVFFSRLDQRINPNLQDEVHSLYQSLRNIYEDLIPAFSKSTDSSEANLSLRDVRKIEIAIKNLETWNDRFLKFAIIILFFDQSEVNTSKDARQRTLSTYDALDRVHKLREAVQETLTNTVVSTKLLLDWDDANSSRTRIPNSDLWMICKASGGDPSATMILVEDRPYSHDIDTVALNRTRRTVRDIALILHEADSSTMGVLRCQGFRHDSDHSRFELHFNVPYGVNNPRSLRDIMKDPKYQDVGAVHPLNDRLNLAKKLASAVFFIHSGDWVHKNIRPENIVIFEPILSVNSDADAEVLKYRQFPRALGAPYLVGYDGVRKVDAMSDRTAVEDPTKRIYLSPERHRLRVGDEFTMQHDVYSLGVVLLEIALWKDLSNHASSVGKVLWERRGVLKPFTTLHENLISLARTRIPRFLGQKYTDAVIACLTGLRDIDNSSELEDQDGVIVGVAYITLVLKRLEQIVL